MCCKLGLSTARFLSETMPIGDPKWEHARQALCRPSRESSSGRTSFAFGQPSVIVTAGSEPPLKRTRDSVRPLLEAALRQPNAPSLPAVARQLGYLNPSSLITWHPDLCYALVAKARARRQTQDENPVQRLPACSAKRRPYPSETFPFGSVFRSPPSASDSLR